MVSQASLQACSFFLARLAEEVIRLQRVVYPGHHPGPKKWLRFIAGLVDTADIYLARAANDPAAATAAKALSDAEDLGNNAYSLLHSIAGADSRDIPHQVVAPFQRWATSLGVNDTLCFRAEHLPNYELMWWDFSGTPNVLDDSAITFKHAAGDINWPFRRVTVPSSAMGMLPHFAVVAHELGHAIQDKINVDLSAHHQAWADLETRITQRLHANNIIYGHEHQVRVGVILRSWVNELKADAVGLMVAGPSFFFAFTAFLELSGRSYGISATHPSSDLRRRHLFQRLAEGAPSFIDVMQQDIGFVLLENLTSPNIPDCPSGDALFNDLKGLGIVDSALITELALYIDAIARTVFDDAKLYLNNNCSALMYTPGDLRRDIADFVGPLCALIPPIERRSASGAMEPSSLATILNVGWITLLAKLDEIPIPTSMAANPVAKRMERLHELLLKALELSESRRIWDENK